MLSERDKTVLRDVARIAGSQDVAFYVIGAGARLLVYDWPNELIAGRGTTDWDIAVRVSSWVEYERLSRALTAEGAWRNHSRSAAGRSGMTSAGVL